MNSNEFIINNNVENIDEIRERADNYLTALAQIYDEIFEIDIENGTANHVYGKCFDILPAAGAGEPAEARVLAWINNIVAESDRKNVTDAFNKFFNKGAEDAKKLGAVQTEFTTVMGDVSRTYLGVFLAMKKETFLMCCSVIDERETDRLRRENVNLRYLNDNMKEIVKHFTDGMLAFKIENDSVTPLYISDNICDFFGIDTDEWIFMMNSGMPVSEFVAKSNFEYEDFQRLLREGEEEFYYTDVVSGEEKCIRAVSTIYFSENGPAFYIMLHEAAKKSIPEKRKMPKVQIRTFGYFDVFVDGKTLAFRNEKAKELLALLVDRRGGFISSSEAINFLWEDEPANKVTLARYRKVAMRLKNFLEEYGIEDIVETVGGQRRIVPEAVQCDLYDYLAQEDKTGGAFSGLYLSNYSWAETTLGELLVMSGQIDIKED